MKRFIIYLFIISLSICSCEKAETDGDKVVESIIQYAEDGNFKTVDYWIDGKLQGLDKPYSFKAPFIFIDGDFYNLNMVISYGSDKNSLQLYF